jgi:putative aldouronate transport system substrate-binding protein
MLSALLVAGMLLGLLAGCGSTASTQEPASSAPETAQEASAAEPAAEPETPAEAPETPEEPASQEESAAEPEEYVYTGEWATYPLEGDNTLTMWCEFPGFLSMVGIDSYKDCSVFAAAEEATGVHIEFTEVSMMNASEQFSLMCASGDMKDILGGTGSYYGSTAAAIEEEIIIDLAPYAEKYMGNYMTILNDPRYEAYKENAYNSEGQLPEISSISDEYKPTAGMQIRKDWLEKLDLDTPETYDDLENVLKAFKENYGCSSAFLMSGSTQVNNLIAGYGTTGAAEDSMGGSTVNMYQVDGVIRNGYQDESYKAYLTMMNRWYKEGLISPDFITASSDGSQNNMDGDIIAGNCGVWYAQGNFVGQYESQAQVTEPDFSIMGLADPYSPEYNPEKTTHFTTLSGGNSGGSGALSVSTNCEDVQLACQWLDYFWTEPGQILCNYGIEGEGFEYVDGKPQFTDFIINGGNFQFMMTGYTLSGVPTYTDFDKSFFTYSDNVLEAFDIWAACVDDLYTLPSGLTLTSEQSDAYTSKFNDINTMAEERVGKFITGEADIETQWDTFQADLISMGIEDCIAVYQEAYDDYMATR